MSELVERVRIEIWDWRTHIPTRSEFDDLDQAVARLRLLGPADISISRGDGQAIVAGGHDGRFVLMFTPNEGVDNWHVETSTPPDDEQLNDLIVGGQAGDYPAHYRLTEEELETALRWFVRNGGMAAQLKWVQD